MATDLAFDAIRSFVEAEWSECKLAWDNEPFEVPQPFGDPDSVTGEAVPNSWGRILVDGDLYEQVSIGAGDPADERHDETGSVTLMTMTPVGTGSRENRRLMRMFAQMCCGQDIGQIEFLGARIDPIGDTDESGNWWQMNVTIQWIRRS